MNFIQILNIIANYNIRCPDLVSSMWQTLAQLGVSSDQYFTFDCFLIHFKSNIQGSFIYVKKIIGFISPVFLIILSLIFWAARFKVKKIPILGSLEFKNTVIATIVILLFNLQPVMIQNYCYYFSVKTCIEMINLNII